MRRILGATAAAALLALTVTGCATAVAGQASFDTACGLMTESAQREAGSDCEKAVQDTDFSTTQRDAMRRIEVDAGQVQVSGDSAKIPASAFSVDGRQSSSSGRLEAARAGAEWLIDGVG